MNLLALDNVHIKLGSRDVIKDISFTVAPGEFVGLIGPNGAGKSTLLRAITGGVPYSGFIKIKGSECQNIAAPARAMELAFLPQERDIVWNISVEELVGLGRSPYLTPFGSLRSNDLHAVDAAMKRMDIAAFRTRPVSELSGGEKARVLVARALAQETPLLLADEPTAGLDPAHNLALMQILAGLAEEGKGVIASTHDLGFAATYCTRLILLDQGRIVADGKPQEVLTKERMRTVYGVEAYLATVEGRTVLQPTSLAAKPG
ncbi:MAG: ABC transporter ATP-binding protein [Rhizobiaceae bacterium]|nr:ABC transporter ATP-binding protein [Rhizobiaceae bacterium]